MEISEIAQVLNLKKMQVNAIISYFHSPQNDEASPQDGEETWTDAKRSDASGMEDPDLTASAIIEEYSTPVEGTNPVSIPAQGVDEPEEEKTEKEGIFIGSDKEYGEALFWNPQNTARIQNPHMMIVGESGSGNTEAVQ